jgi:S-adenosylmethionine hydrolase
MPEELGPALEPASLVRLELPAAEIHEGEIRTIVLLVDRFGNAQLNVVGADLERAGIAPGAQVEIGEHSATVARTFADAPAGGLLLYEDAYGRLALAMAGGNAAETLSIRVGDELTIART